MTEPTGSVSIAEKLKELRPQFIAMGLPPESDDSQTSEWINAKYPELVRLSDFSDIVYRESDRGCVICATAFIDDALEMSIRRHLRELSNASDGLLDKLLKNQPLPPLGSFAVRSRMARALGIIDDKMLSSLDG